MKSLDIEEVSEKFSLHPRVWKATFFVGVDIFLTKNLFRFKKKLVPKFKDLLISELKDLFI